MGGGELWVVSPGEDEFNGGSHRTWSSRRRGLEIPAITLMFSRPCHGVFIVKQQSGHCGVVCYGFLGRCHSGEVEH